MTTGERLADLRKKKNWTQEQLADALDISRQAVSKWESDAAYPDTDKLMQLAELYGVSVDYLLRGNAACKSAHPWKWHYEYKSKRSWRGLPLVHVNVGIGFYRAKGVIAVGNIACGLLSVGVLSVGLFAFGSLAIGLLALGAMALGLLALGAIAVGFMALGAIALGVVAIGALSVGCVSFGAFGCGLWFAVGDHAYAQIAIGDTLARGPILAIQGEAVDVAALTAAVQAHVPAFFRPICLWWIGLL